MHVGLILCAVLGAAPPTGGAFPRGNAAELGLDASALEALATRAQGNGTDALVVVKDGKVVLEWYAPGGDAPAPCMAVTQSVVGLALGRLMEMGRLKSLDEPVHDTFPEWNQGRKKDITLRHLLGHTSGLQAERTTAEIYQAPDVFRLAMAAELSTEPGTAFFYNHKAVNILPVLVQQKSGKRLDRFAADELFKPLGIRDATWDLDKGSNPLGMAGLKIRPVDLARLGVLVADGGAWNGKQLIHKTWMSESAQPGNAYNPQHGLLWWLEPEWRRLTLDEETVRHWRQAGMETDVWQKMSAFKGQTFARGELKAAIEKRYGGDELLARWSRELERLGVPPGQAQVGPTLAVSARGYLGQYLVVVPREKLVAVRVHHVQDGDDEDEGRRVDFPSFEQDVLDLLPHKPD